VIVAFVFFIFNLLLQALVECSSSGSNPPFSLGFRSKSLLPVCIGRERIPKMGQTEQYQHS
jgi:hypothetical protein